MLFDSKKWLETYFYSTSVSFDINNVPDDDFFFQYGFVDARIKSKLFCAFYRLQTDDDVRYRLAITAQWVLGLRRCQFCHFTFVYLFSLLYPQS
jgi:hypothetical protein